MTKDICFDWHHILNTYNKIVKNEMQVVEIGCSTLSRTIDLAKKCKKLTGIEKFANRIPQNKSMSRFKIKILNADWANLSKVVKPNSIDIVLASHVIEHVDDDLRCINESYRVLKKGGYLIFNTPNRKRLVRSIIELFTGERKFPFLEHIREYVRNDIYILIKKSSFSKSEAKISGLVLGIHGMGIRLFINKVPLFLDKYSNFWEIIIQK